VAAWAGGKDGTDSLDLLMPQIANALSPHGLFYVVILAQNKPNEVSRRMKSHGFPHAKVVMKQQIIGELLYIVRFSRVDEASLRGQFTPT
jgi:release factor glutamine methyltransferase